MTADHVEKTLANSLDLRLKGNKAPMHIGCHTDYFTPMYDYATLSSDFNKDKYGLVISQNWNTWQTRKTAFENFVTYAKGKGAKFKSGKEVIEAIKGYQTGEKVGTENTYSGMKWSFNDWAESNKSTTSATEVTGDLNNISVKIPAGFENSPTFNTYEGMGQFAGLTHVSLDYKTNTALSLQLFVDGDKPWEVLLNNLNKDVNSGKIPLGAFHYNQYDIGTQTAPDLSKVTGMAIRVLKTEEALDAQFTVKNIKTYGAKIIPTPIAGLVTGKNSFVKLNGVNANTLNLNVANAGVYSVEIFTANGRMVRSIESQNLQAGANNVKLNALPAGVYMMKISNQSKSQVIKAIVM